MAKMKKGPTIKSLPVAMGKGSKGGDGMQKAPAIKGGKVKMSAGAASGPGRLQKMKAYGAKKGSGR